MGHALRLLPATVVVHESEAADYAAVVPGDQLITHTESTVAGIRNWLHDTFDDPYQIQIADPKPLGRAEQTPISTSAPPQELEPIQPKLKRAQPRPNGAIGAQLHPPTAKTSQSEFPRAHNAGSIPPGKGVLTPKADRLQAKSTDRKSEFDPPTDQHHPVNA